MRDATAVLAGSIADLYFQNAPGYISNEAFPGHLVVYVWNSDDFRHWLRAIHGLGEHGLHFMEQRVILKEKVPTA